MYICEWKATYIMIKHDFWATEKIIFNGMSERSDLNYQPMTDMTQCASELNQIKSFIFKTIVEYTSTCTLSYMFYMFFRCGSTCYMLKIQTNYAREWVEWYKMTVSGFTSELFTLENTGGALQVKGFWYMLHFMYFEVDYLICPCFKAKFQKSNKEI